MLELYQHEDRIDIACEYLRSSINEISEIFGRVDAEDVLDVLFKEFCIGKWLHYGFILINAYNQCGK